ncbi:MAG: hypothetical protein IPN79_17745 [Saprospiraceae bacterium]|nr:hypothetical protein [Saprospiraceae bacterium]
MNYHIKKLKSLSTGLSIIFGMLMCVNILSASAVFNKFIPEHYNAGTLIGTKKDTIPYATVFVYRPENQLSRKYRIKTNIDGAFDLKKNEVVKMNAGSNTFFIEVDATGHKKQAFTFNLDQNKTHYFRIQDRNNYAGFLAFLEVIEVTEETFKREKR